MFKFRLFIILALIVFLLPLSGQAAFNKNDIISDWEMEDYTSMTLKRIKAFLQAQGGALSNYITTDTDGQAKSAAEIIYNAAQQYRLSPKFIITHVQKESSLVTNGSSTSSLLDWAMGFGVCDGCSKDDPRVIKYKGFAKQIYAAADRIRNGYLADLESKNSTISGWGVGRSKTTSDGIAVTPANKATAVLYTYTPWVGYYGGRSNVGGNSLFYDIWQRWFASSSLLYPSGALLQSNETGIVYLIRGLTKQPFNSKAALLANYDLAKIILVSENTLDQYEEGTAIYFPNYSLMRSPNGTVYIYVDGQKRGLTSAETLRNIGINPEEIINASWSDLNTIPEGDPITSEDVYPTGVLLQNDSTGAVFYVDPEGIRHPIWAAEILESQFPNRPLVSSNQSEIKEYPNGQPLKFKDGELITAPGAKAVYVIANGYKRPFASQKVFDQLGYKWDNVIVVEKDLLKLHPTGKKVTLPAADDKQKKK